MHEKLRGELTALGLTQAELARMTGIGLVSVNRWATGRRPVPAWLWSYLRLVGEARVLARMLMALGGLDHTQSGKTGKP